MCGVLVSPHGLKNDAYFMCCALVWPHGLYFMCCALVWPHGLKNDECYMRCALVSPHGVYTTYISCVARLFGLMAERYFLCLLRTDFR